MNTNFKFFITFLLVSLSSGTTKLPLHVGNGYDIFYGNPLNNRIDPGFRSQIFSFTYLSQQLTYDGKYLIPDGMRSTNTPACNFDSKSQEITGAQSYQESLKQAVSVEGGYDNGIAAVSFTASVAYKSTQEMMTRENRIIYFSTGSCEEYTLTAPAFDTLPLENDFIVGVTDAYTKKIWSSFINRYGTHYVITETLGGRMVISTSFSKKDVEFLKSNEIDIGVGVKASYGFVSGKVDSNTAMASKFTKATSNMNIINSYIYVGGVTNSDNNWFKWTESVRDRLAPIQYKLVQISELFTSKNFPQMSPSQLDEMKTQFIKAAAESCGKNCQVPQPDIPIPPVTTKLIFTGTYGGSNGVSYSFDLSLIKPYMKVKKVDVCSGTVIDSIQFTLVDGLGNLLTLARHGGNGGVCSDWTLDDNEHIKTIELYTGKYFNSKVVVGLSFITNKGNNKFWGSKGQYNIIHLNGELVGTRGGYGAVIDRMEFVTALKYMGCFPDLPTNSRDLNGLNLLVNENGGGKVETCIDKCKGDSFNYAGMQYGKECYCGNSFGKYGTKNEMLCNMPCPNDQNAVCGGPAANSIYLVD